MTELFRSMIHFQLSIYRYIIYTHTYLGLYWLQIFINTLSFFHTYLSIYHVYTYVYIYIHVHPYYVCVSLHVEFPTPGRTGLSPGSGRVGKLILQAAAPNLTPATWRHPQVGGISLAKAIEKCCVNIEKPICLYIIMVINIVNNNLVGGLEHDFLWLSIYWECHHPKWLSYFSEGLKTPTSIALLIDCLEKPLLYNP